MPSVCSIESDFLPPVHNSQQSHSDTTTAPTTVSGQPTAAHPQSECVTGGKLLGKFPLYKVDWEELKDESQFFCENFLQKSTTQILEENYNAL